MTTIHPNSPVFQLSSATNIIQNTGGKTTGRKTVERLGRVLMAPFPQTSCSEPQNYDHLTLFIARTFCNTKKTISDTEQIFTVSMFNVQFCQ